MPAPQRRLTAAGVRRFADEICLPAAPRERRVGAELEWLVWTGEGERADGDVVRRALDPLVLAGASHLSVEPGGQLELSSAPTPSLRSMCSALASDEAAVRAALAPAGIDLVAVGLDPTHPPRRILDVARYVAMERYFDDGGEVTSGAGRTMMANTASIQVNVDAAGQPGDREARWRRAHAVGPVLAASFANSPMAGGAPTGWRSTRLATWHGIDPTRTSPAHGGGQGATDEWAQYILRARVMLIRTGGGATPVTRPLPFGQWLEEGHDLGWPTEEDLAYHVSTLFPPVRAKGWLELRMIDALPDPWWRVAVAVAAALVESGSAGDAGVERAAAPAAGRWREAARHGLRHPALAGAAKACFALALDLLQSGPAVLDVDDATLDAVRDYVDRYVGHDRCPADDTLDQLAVVSP